jgi:CubicO group peptidase (beta-lactamase class C family)
MRGFDENEEAANALRGSPRGDRLPYHARQERCRTRGAARHRCSRNEPRGFSADGLERLRSGLQRHLEPGFAPDLVGLVARGDVEAFVLGKMAFDGGADMRRDSIFRITSMTKAITAAAVMMLVEQGKLRLDEPVNRLRPS